MCTAVGFDSSFDYERTFSCQEIGTFLLVDSSKDFLSGCTNNKIEPGFMTLTELPGEPFERSSA